MNLIIVYAVILGLLFLFLSLNAERLRQNHKLKSKTSLPENVYYAVRGQENFVEFVPFSFILILLCESVDVTTFVLNLLLSTLTFGRIIHAYGCTINYTQSYRLCGMVLTYISVVLSLAYLGISLFLD